MPPMGVRTPLAWLTALREKDPVTGNDENREPTILLSERAISSFVGFKPAPPNALEIATFPKTAMIGTTTIDGPSSATYIQENSYLHFLIKYYCVIYIHLPCLGKFGVLAFHLRREYPFRSLVDQFEEIHFSQNRLVWMAVVPIVVRSKRYSLW